MKKITTLLILLVAGLVGYAQTAEQEPNNSFGTANYITKVNVKTDSIVAVCKKDLGFTCKPTHSRYDYIEMCRAGYFLSEVDSGRLN